MARRRGDARDGHSSGTPVTGRLEQPTRATTPGKGAEPKPLIAPIRFCSRRGLPCRGTLPPARCALTAPFHPYRQSRRFAFCGAIPGVAPAGRYPAPYFRGARTFLHPERQRPSGRLAGREIGGAEGGVKFAPAPPLRRQRRFDIMGSLCLPISHGKWPERREEVSRQDAGLQRRKKPTAF
jgi:hypothetical protein